MEYQTGEEGEYPLLGFGKSGPDVVRLSLSLIFRPRLSVNESHTKYGEGCSGGQMMFFLYEYTVFLICHRYFWI